MVRSAAKNHEYVAILTDPADYDAFVAELEASGGSTSLELRRRLAARAFAATAAYDAMISQWFAGVDQGEKFPPVRAMASRLAMPLRYGERSEEHTSELQSLMRNSYAVFCLKYKHSQQTPHTTSHSN